MLIADQQMVIAYVYPEECRHQELDVSSQTSELEDGNGREASTTYRNALIRRFDFSSQLQRMSVICKNRIDRGMYKSFVKGSPEKIFELCKRDSVPKNFEQVLKEYTQEGYRVIALAYKDLPEGCNYRTILNMPRVQAESDLTFLGLLIMENKMKDVTAGVIETLQECEVDTIMATGDNVLTAISVAGQCGIIDRKDQVYLGDLSIDEQS